MGDFTKRRPSSSSNLSNLFAYLFNSSLYFWYNKVNSSLKVFLETKISDLRVAIWLSKSTLAWLSSESSLISNWLCRLNSKISNSLFICWAFKSWISAFVIWRVCNKLRWESSLCFSLPFNSWISVLMACLAFRRSKCASSLVIFSLNKSSLILICSSKYPSISLFWSNFSALMSTISPALNKTCFSK